MDGRQRTWEKRCLLLFVCSCHRHSASILMHPSICFHWRKVSTRRSFPDFPGSDIPQQPYSVQMESPSLSFQSRKPRHMHLPESGRRRQKTGVQYHLWRYRMAAMTAEPASRFIITAMLPEHQTPGFGTGWAFPIKREALEPGTYRLLYWELPEFSP